MKLPKLLSISILLGAALSGLGADELVLGFATGFPPYQYQDSRGRPLGLDVVIAREVFREMDQGYRIEQGPWDDMVARLRLDKGVDVLGGMEISGERQQLFDFSQTLYKRQSLIFLRKDNDSIHSLTDLEGRTITGDRNSFVETLMSQKGQKPNIRIIETSTKEEAMVLLKNHRVEACLMPASVGFYLARIQGLEVRTVDAGDPGTPVAFAVRKGQTALREALNQAIRRVQEKGRLEPLLQQFTPGS